MSVLSQNTYKMYKEGKLKAGSKVKIYDFDHWIEIKSIEHPIEDEYMFEFTYEDESKKVKTLYSNMICEIEEEKKDFSTNRPERNERFGKKDVVREEGITENVKDSSVIKSNILDFLKKHKERIREDAKIEEAKSKLSTISKSSSKDQQKEVIADVIILLSEKLETLL